MPPEDMLDQLARLARDDDALHAASERRPRATKDGEAAPISVLPESLTQPISAARQSSFVDAIQAKLANAEHVPSPVPLASAPRRRRGALVAFVAAMAAAAIVLLVLRGSPDADSPLSRYEARLEGSERAERGTVPASQQLRLLPNSQLHFALRPNTDVQGSVRARAFLQSLAVPREIRELQLTQEQSAAGALRVTARLPASLFERGELLLYVGRNAVIERSAPEREPQSATTPSAAQEFRWPFERAPQSEGR